MLRIHHLVLSRSDRIVWLAEELGVPYELVKHHRDGTTFRAPPSLWAVSPMGKAPAIEDDGHTICESGAVIEYMLDKYGNGRLRPKPGTDEFFAYREWLHAAESTLMVPILTDLLCTLTQSNAPALKAFYDGEYETLFKYLDSTLAKKPYVAGQELTGADINVAYSLQLADGSAIPVMKAGAPVQRFPNILAYLERVSARPAFLRAKAACA